VEKGFSHSYEIRRFGLAGSGDDESSFGGQFDWELRSEVCELLDKVITTLVVLLEGGDAENDERFRCEIECRARGCSCGGIGGRPKALDVYEVWYSKGKLGDGTVGLIIVPITGREMLEVRKLVEDSRGFFGSMGQDDAGAREPEAV
jgi:hypothetical protein